MARVRAIRDHFDGVYRKAGEEFDHVVGEPSKHVEVLDEPEGEEEQQPATTAKKKGKKEE